MSNCQRMLNKEWNLKLFYSSLLFHSLTLVPLRELQLKEEIERLREKKCCSWAVTDPGCEEERFYYRTNCLEFRINFLTAEIKWKLLTHKNKLFLDAKKEILNNENNKN